MARVFITSVGETNDTLNSVIDGSISGEQVFSCSSVALYGMAYKPNLTKAVFPKCKETKGSSMTGNTFLATIEFYNLTNVGGSSFSDSTSLTTFINRYNGIAYLSNSNAFSNTKIATSTTEGFIYVPDELSVDNVGSKLGVQNVPTTITYNSSIARLQICPQSNGGFEFGFTSNNKTINVSSGHIYFVYCSYAEKSTVNTGGSVTLVSYDYPNNNFTYLFTKVSTVITSTYTYGIFSSKGDGSNQSLSFWVPLIAAETDISQVVYNMIILDLTELGLENVPLEVIFNALTTAQLTTLANGESIDITGISLVNSYKSATNWSTFASKIKGISELGE